MKQLGITCVFGYTEKKAVISCPGGYNGGYQIFIDNWYEGVIAKPNGEWAGHLNGMSISCSAVAGYGTAKCPVP